MRDILLKLSGKTLKNVGRVNDCNTDMMQVPTDLFEGAGR
jgi:hypothetical protein